MKDKERDEFLELSTNFATTTTAYSVALSQSLLHPQDHVRLCFRLSVHVWSVLQWLSKGTCHTIPRPP